MKSVQINQVLEGIEVDSAVDGDSIQVAHVGPLTVAVQLSVSSSNNPTNAAAQLEGSLDGINFFPVGSPISVAGDGELCVTDKDVAFVHYRVSFAIDTGSFEVVQRFVVYGVTV